MNLQTRNPDLATGELLAYVNGSNMRNGGRGFAVIQLDEHGLVDLVFDEPEEFDRLIDAASAGKQKLINAREPHDFHPAEGTNRCLDCGVLKAHHVEPEPGPYDEAIRQAEAFAQPGNTVDDILAEQAAGR